MGESENQHFHDFGISGRVLELQDQLFLFLERPGYFKYSRNIPEPFSKNMFFTYRQIGHPKLKNMEKTGAGNFQRSVKQFLDNLGYAINIFQKA